MRSYFISIIVGLLSLISGSLSAAFTIFPSDYETAGFVGMASQGPLDEPVMVTNYTEFTTIFGASTAGLANPYLAPSVAGFFANGGLRLVVVRIGSVDDSTVIGTDGGVIGSRTGLQALLENEAFEVSIIAIPGVTSIAVQTAMINHCEAVGNRIAVLDSDSPDDLAQVQSQRAGLASADGFGALYFPWIQAAPTGASLLLPPSGFVAASYATHEPHASPVGLIATATEVAYSISSAEQDQLNLQNINAIRNLSGIRIWGARTLSTSVDLRYIAVRRMLSFTHQSIYNGTLWCTFDENTPLVWSTIQQDVDDFLQTLFTAGWLQGASSNLAYFSRCDQSTMTALDLLEGRTVIIFGLAIIAPAEFVISTVIQQREDISAVPSPELTFFTLAPPAPNPFNPTTTLRFELARDANVNLSIFDLSGRLVRRVLTTQPLLAGEYEQRWNGRDDAGRAVSSGVYLVRLQTGADFKTQRMVLAR